METLVIPAITPEVEVPEDKGLPGLSRLFDNEWVWSNFCKRWGIPEDAPDTLRLQQFLYHPGRWALVAYAAERQWGKFVVQDQFGIEMHAGKVAQLFRYPSDPYLPGLEQAASPVPAHDLVNTHLGLHHLRLIIDPVSYLPTSHAVLRYELIYRRGNRVVLYLRVLPPARVPRIMAAHQAMQNSGFHTPHLAGAWPEGGLLWLSEFPGRTVRKLIRYGKAPEPERILEAISQLWEAEPPAETKVPDIRASFRGTHGLLDHVLEDEEGKILLERVAKTIGPFAENWRPTGLAHNDFYDAQIVVTRNGEMGIVDYDEAGPGDPLLDVGNFLAHMRWISHFSKKPEPTRQYGEHLREAALQRFGWDRDELAIREAFALFRLSTNGVRRLKPGWQDTLRRVLGLVLKAVNDTSTRSFTGFSLDGQTSSRSPDLALDTIPNPGVLAVVPSRPAGPPLLLKLCDNVPLELIRNVPYNTVSVRRRVLGRTFANEREGTGPQSSIRDGKPWELESGRCRQTSGLVLPPV